MAIAHSIGGLATLLAAEAAPPLTGHASFESLVLIATPNRFWNVTREFGEYLGLSPTAQDIFERRLARVGHRAVDSLYSADLAAKLNLPTLVIHSRDDAQVAFTDGEDIAAKTPNAQLAAFDKLGHAGVLFAPPAIRVVREFCARA